MGLWDINNAYFKYSIWASGIATNFTKMEVRGTLRVNYDGNLIRTLHPGFKWSDKEGTGTSSIAEIS